MIFKNNSSCCRASTEKSVFSHKKYISYSFFCLIQQLLLLLSYNLVTEAVKTNCGIMSKTFVRRPPTRSAKKIKSNLFFFLLLLQQHFHHYKFLFLLPWFIIIFEILQKKTRIFFKEIICKCDLCKWHSDLMSIFNVFGGKQAVPIILNASFCSGGNVLVAEIGVGYFVQFFLCFQCWRLAVGIFLMASFHRCHHHHFV